MSGLAESLVQKIRAKSASIGVIGLGYVGLPFAVEQAKVGLHVVGFDYNDARVGQVNRAENYIGDVDDSELEALVGKGLIRATTNMDELSDMDVVVIAVPTPLNKNLNPDLHCVEDATKEIAKKLKRGQLISLESTTYPGTTSEVMKPILEATGLKAGIDFFLAYSPERVDPGNQSFTTKNTNKVVGADDPTSLKVSIEFYQQAIVKVIPVSSSSAAEMAKIFENTFRAVNIALVNEMAMLCDRLNLNVWEILDAAFTKPFGIMPFYPGPGVGGHCIPLDPHYLEWKAREFNFSTRFIALAGEINRHMPEFVVQKCMRILSDKGKGLRNAKVLALGVAYKKDIDDARESPSVEVIHLLHGRGVSIEYHDPFVAKFMDKGLELASVALTEDSLRSADLVIVLTDHSDIDYQLVARTASLVLDTRNVFRRRQIESPALVCL